MIDPIRIHAQDSEDQMKARHARVIDRLESLGATEARAMFARDDFPHPWHPIIRAWLRSKD